MKESRKQRLMPNGIPKYVRCYDNKGETADRYTVVFTGRYTQKTDRHFYYLGMSSNPFHPQGVGMLGSQPYQPIDRPTYSHLGRKIRFTDLPEKCQECVIQDYVDFWDL